jgi:hypothetical protein
MKYHVLSAALLGIGFALEMAGFSSGGVPLLGPV